MSMPIIKTVPNKIAGKVVIITEVPKILFLSFIGKKRIIEKSNPNLEINISNPIEDISAVAIPTSSTGYNFAASIQKIKPNPAPEIEVSMMKNEFLNNGS